MRYRIERSDCIRFTRQVREHHAELRVAPWDDTGQRLLELRVDASDAAPIASHRDCFGNQVHRTALLAAHDALTVQMTAEVQTLLDNPFELEPVPADREPDWIRDSLRQAPRLWDFVLHRSALTPDLASVHISGDAGPDRDGASAEAPAPPPWHAAAPLLVQVQEAMAWISGEFSHDPDADASGASLDSLLGTRSGSAADLSHLLISIVRGWSMPARFVVGYLDAAYFDRDDDEPDAPPRPQAVHSWMEVLIPGGGWRGFDPAKGLLADDSYIRVAVGRDAGDLPGFRHSFKGEGEPESLITTVRVERLA